MNSLALWWNVKVWGNKVNTGNKITGKWLGLGKVSVSKYLRGFLPLLGNLRTLWSLIEMKEKVLRLSFKVGQTAPLKSCYSTTFCDYSSSPKTFEWPRKGSLLVYFWKMQGTHWIKLCCALLCGACAVERGACACGHFPRAPEADPWGC